MYTETLYNRIFISLCPGSNFFVVLTLKWFMVVCEKWEIWFNLIIFNFKKRRERNYRRNDGECCRWSTPADLEDPSWPSDREAGPVRAAPEVHAVQPAEVPEISETATECRQGWRPSNHRPTTPRTSPAVPKIWVRFPALTNEKKFIPNDPNTPLPTTPCPPYGEKWIWLSLALTIGIC
jgi:hypothetical protein